MAAKHHQTIAEVYETEAVDLDRAVQHYEQAADYFKGEESNSSANKCLLKVAQYAAQLENYDKAIQIYEQVMIFCPVKLILKTHGNFFHYFCILNSDRNLIIVLVKRNCMDGISETELYIGRQVL